MQGPVCRKDEVLEGEMVATVHEMNIFSQPISGLNLILSIKVNLDVLKGMQTKTGCV